MDLRENNAAVTEESRVLALLYHELRPEPAEYSYVMPCGRFVEHLQLFDRQDGSQSGLTPVVTFDDGHLSNYEYALPLLQQHGRAAHFFITAGWTGRRSGYMRAEHLRSLHAAGQHIGAHGWTHTLLTACSADQLQRELVDAKAALEDILSSPVTSLSLPGGRSNATVLDACEQAGYTTVWTSIPRAEHAPLGRTVGRYNILSSATTGFLQSLLDPGSGVLRSEGRKHRVKAALKQVVGDRLYAKLWAVVNREESPEAASTASGTIRETAR